MADIVVRANAVFGPDGPSPNRNARQDQLFLVAPVDSENPDPWEQLDRAFFAYPDDIAGMLTAFLRAHGRLSSIRSSIAASGSNAERRDSTSTR
jgi:hypothetical protein